MNKKSRTTKEANPYIGRLKKISDIAGDCYITKNSYENLVNSRREKLGLEGNFEAQKPSGKHHISPTILQKDKDENVYYQQHYFLKEETRVKVKYELDGKEVDIKDFADYLTPSFFEEKVEGGSQGLPEEDAIIIRTPKLENVVYLKVGDYKFSK